VTKDEACFQDAVRQIGCIVCLTHHGLHSPCDIHHILSGGRRSGEMNVLGLCVRHHRDGGDNKEWTSRHPWRLKFEKRYGTELELLERTRELVMRREDFASRAAILEEAK
jgi:hypothetical protein